MALSPILAALAWTVPGASFPVWEVVAGAGALAFAIGALAVGPIEPLHRVLGRRAASVARPSERTSSRSRPRTTGGAQFRRIEGPVRTMAAVQPTGADGRTAGPVLETAPVPSPNDRSNGTGRARPAPQFQAFARMLADIDRLEIDLSGDPRGRRAAAQAAPAPEFGTCVGCDLRFDHPSEPRSECLDCHGRLCSECGVDALHDGHDGRCPTCWTLYETFVRPPERAPAWGQRLPGAPRSS